MPRTPPRPTQGELAILQVLWTRGPSTVREVHDALADARQTGYTTTLKLMQIMASKGLVSRDGSARPHVYTAKLAPESTRGQIVTELIERVFGGSAAALVMQALSAKPATPDEIKEIQRLLTEFKKRRT